MASNKNDMFVQFSKLTESEIDKFCLDHGVDPSLETQLALVGVARVMHLEILCHALSYEPSLFLFRRFFRLTRNGDWYTIEKTQCEAPLLSAIEPELHELEWEFLLRLRAYRTKLRTYSKELLVVLGISQDWVDSCFEPVFFVDQKGMYFCIEQKEIPEDGPSIVRRTEHVRTAGDLESVPIQPIVDSSSAKKQLVPIRRSTRRASSPNVAPQSSDPISVDSGDEDAASVIASVPEASGGAGDAPALKISVGCSEEAE
ncbi:hypothetical protein Hanom_Chr16g01491881 [Helianthus anomalus]